MKARVADGPQPPPKAAQELPMSDIRDMQANETIEICQDSTSMPPN